MPDPGIEGQNMTYSGPVARITIDAAPHPIPKWHG